MIEGNRRSSRRSSAQRLMVSFAHAYNDARNRMMQWRSGPLEDTY